MAAKRPREETDAKAAGPTPPQRIDERADEQKIVVNSPYGTTRSSRGWGTPFAKPLLCAVAGLPQLRIGLSSLNAVPGKVREMGPMLQQYQRKFTVLEHCATYHRVNDNETWDKWVAMAGKGDFLFTVKAHNFLTHTKQLAMDDELAEHVRTFFIERCSRLGSKLGAVLVQLPPSFHFSAAHLARFSVLASMIPSTVPIAVEFRHVSWYCEETYAVFRSIKWALVAAHYPGEPRYPIVDTGSSLMYVRLHGAVDMYVGDYGTDALLPWVEEVKSFIRSKGPDSRVLFFFNNNESHIAGLTSSVVDATEFTTLFGKAA